MLHVGENVEYWPKRMLDIADSHANLAQKSPIIGAGS